MTPPILVSHFEECGNQMWTDELTNYFWTEYLFKCIDPNKIALKFVLFLGHTLLILKD